MWYSFIKAEKQYPEFYASYKLINIKNHRKYSDNLTLNVVDLSHIELAAEEDIEYQNETSKSMF